MPCLHNAVAVLERDERFRGVFGCDELQFSAAALSTLGACLAAAGSCPAARIERALLAASRASTRETAGYLPIESSFSLPSMRYFNRHNLPPAGVTAKYRPPPSDSLYVLSAGLAFFI